MFYDGDVIKKIINWDNSGLYEHREIDTELLTRNRQFILPKTAKGKEKKITPTNLLAPIPSGCILYITFYPLIRARNVRNCIELPITDYEDVKSITDLRKWLENYIKTCPADYFEKVHRMRTMVHRTIKYKVGDIFRFEIDREHYGYGIIIGKIHELLKYGVFLEDHPMRNLMTVPILTRIYFIKTKNKNLTVEELSRIELLPADCMSDNEIIWGTHEIVGRKTLNEKDIDFPIHIGCRRNGNGSELYFGWGSGLRKIAKFNLDVLPEKIKNGDFNNTGVSLGLNIGALKRKLKGESEYNRFRDILHPENRQIKDEIFKLFGLPSQLNFDDFNRENNGMTKAEYVKLNS